MAAHPYEYLTPEVILDAIEHLGMRCDGRLVALNSFENRVYQVGIEDGEPIVAKFYRPGRWSRATILEEHAFCAALAANEIPVVAPICDEHGNSLFQREQFPFALYPRRGGRWPELDATGVRTRLGRFLGRIHQVGAHQQFKHRGTLSIASHGETSRQLILDTDYLPPGLRHRYAEITEELLAVVRSIFDQAQPLPLQKIHGDFHPGNVLWTDSGAHLVDFDDCMNGPIIQDLWMLLSTDSNSRDQELAEVLDGYDDFGTFDWRQLQLIEPLRTLRLINYSAWLARRWEDPAFPRFFPWFGEKGYWEDQIATFEQQLARMAL